MSEPMTRQPRPAQAVLARIGASALLLLPVIAAAQPTAATSSDLAARLTALLAQVPPKTQVGLVVVDLSDGQPCFSHQPDKPLKPASLMKLLVSAAAREQLGPGFCYTTQVFVHDDELWVIGSGDPALGDERIARRCGREPLHVFDDWAAALKAAGISTLNKLVLDDTIFERRWRHPDWPPDQSDRWYQAPVGGLNFNDNCLDARVELGDGVPRLVLGPDLPPAFVSNLLRVGQHQGPVLRREPESDVFEFVGTVKHNAEFAPASARRPTVFFGHALRRGLTTRGIGVRGDVVRRTITSASRAGATLIAQHSTPLPDVLWRCNTFSQNLFAECLLKSLTAYGPDGARSGQPGSWEAGAQRLRAILSDMGVDMCGAVLRDGSGLSHGNRLTATQITHLLVLMHHQRHAAAFAESLAVPGEPGSMQRRYNHAALRGRLRAKTGTLSGVRTLAGYVRRPDGRTLAFALLCNGRVDAKLPVLVAQVLVEAPLAE